MNPIALGQPTAYPSTPRSAPPPGTLAGAGRPSVDDLRAEETALQTSVGALGTYAGQFSAAPAAPVTPSATQDPLATMPPLGSNSSSSPTAFTPARSWTSMLGQNGPGGTPAGSSADQGMSQILDAGDVFDTSDD